MSFTVVSVLAVLVAYSDVNKIIMTMWSCQWSLTVWHLCHAHAIMMRLHVHSVCAAWRFPCRLSEGKLSEMCRVKCLGSSVLLK